MRSMLDILLPPQLALEWTTNDTQWYQLGSVNLDSVNSHGVYVIWKEQLTLMDFLSHGSRKKAVRIGQGDIKSRLKAHRRDEKIARHGSPLYVTWAAVDTNSVNGVERYLADTLEPLEGSTFPTDDPIRVNLPLWFW